MDEGWKQLSYVLQVSTQAAVKVHPPPPPAPPRADPELLAHLAMSDAWSRRVHIAW